jgi:hypothetical protein
MARRHSKMKGHYDSEEGCATGCVIAMIFLFGFLVWGFLQVLGSLGGMIR